MDILYSSILDSHFIEKIGITYCILGIYQSKFIESLWTRYKLNPNSALEIYYSFQLLQIQGFQNNF